MALLDAIRALTAFDPPPTLPECDLTELVHVLTAHGLAPLASYQVEHTRLGAGVPPSFREALLGQYQGVVNDNVLKLVGLRGSLRAAPRYRSSCWRPPPTSTGSIPTWHFAPWATCASPFGVRTAPASRPR